MSSPTTSGKPESACSIAPPVCCFAPDFDCFVVATQDCAKPDAQFASLARKPPACERRNPHGGLRILPWNSGLIVFAAYQVTRSSSEKLIVAPSLRLMWPAASWDRAMTWFTVSVEVIEPDVIDSVQSTP